MMTKEDTIKRNVAEKRTNQVNKEVTDSPSEQRGSKVKKELELQPLEYGISLLVYNFELVFYLSLYL